MQVPPPGSRLLPVNVQCIVVGGFDTDCYVLWQEGEGEGGHECVVVDPGDEAEEIVSFLESSDLEPVEVVLTHVHVDHFALDYRYLSL